MPMRYRLFFFILCIFALYIFLAPTRASSRNVLLKYAPLRSADIVIVIDRSPSLNLVTDATVDAAKFLLDYVDAIDPQHEYVRIAIIPFTKSPLKDKERLLAPLDDEAWETIEKLRNGSNLVDNTNFSAALCRVVFPAMTCPFLLFQKLFLVSPEKGDGVTLFRTTS